MAGHVSSNLKTGFSTSFWTAKSTLTGLRKRSIRSKRKNRSAVSGLQRFANVLAADNAVLKRCKRFVVLPSRRKGGLLVLKANCNSLNRIV